MVLEGYAPHSPFDVTDTCRTGVRRDFHQPGWSAAALRPGRRLPTTGNTSRTREKRSIVLLPRSSKMGGSIGLHTHPGPYLAVQRTVRPPPTGGNTEAQRRPSPHLRYLYLAARVAACVASTPGACNSKGYWPQLITQPLPRWQARAAL